MRKFSHFIFILWCCILPVCIHAQDKNIRQYIDNLQYQTVVDYIDSLNLSDSKSQLLKADMLQKTGHITQAQSVWYKLLEKDSLNFDLYQKIADAETAQGNYKQAKNIKEKAYTHFKTKKLLEEIAELNMKMFRLSEALQICNALLEKDTVQSVLRLKAECLLRLTNTSAAIPVLEHAVQRDPLDFLSTRKLAEIYLKQDSVQKVKVLSEKYLEIDTSNQIIKRINALAHYRQKNYHMASSIYKRLTEKGSFNYEDYLYLGICYYKLQNYKDAIDALNRADELSMGGSYAVVYYLGNCYYMYKDYDNSIKYLYYAQDMIKPDSVRLADIYLRLGDNYLKNQNGEAALKEFKKSWQYVNAAETYYYIAVAYDMQGKAKEALQTYGQFLEASKHINPRTEQMAILMQRASESIYRLRKSKK